MRTMYDSVTAADIPVGAQVVGGYKDGTYRWSDADWARFPNAIKVGIVVSPQTNDGHVLDCERGDATPEQCPGWVQMRRTAGADPTVYTGEYQWQAVKDAFVAAHVPEPHWWIARWSGVPGLIGYTVATQYANPTLSGGHYDLSTVADFWPGVDKETVASPTYVGQSVTNMNLVVGEVGEYDAIYNYADHGGDRHIVGKVVAYSPGVRLVTVYPPVDPDADPTQDLDAQPCYFVVAAR